jgi:hypothetical protein
VVVLGTWDHLLEGMVYVPMPAAFRSFRQALVADAVLRRTSFMPISPPKQGTDLEITSLHVLRLKDLVMSARHNEHTWA